MMSSLKKIIVIVGPTASGKSNLGVFLAKKIDGEIISADSRQVYKGLDVGSGKITKKEMKGVHHYCLDIANPKKNFTAYNFQQCAQKAILEIWKKNKIPIIVGGTGFYIDAAVGKITLSNVPPNPKLRKKLQKFSTSQLFFILKKMDTKRAKNIDRNNPVRLIRAIEIVGGETNDHRNGFSPFLAWSPKSASWRTRSKNERTSQAVAGRPRMSGGTSLVYPRILWIGVKRSKEDLKKRICKRLIARIPGIVKEIKKLRNQPTGGEISWKRLFDLGLEYRYVSLYLRKKLSKDDMVKKLETESNKYAKRQMTYFKRNKEIHWLSEKEAKNLGRRFWSA